MDYRANVFISYVYIGEYKFVTGNYIMELQPIRYKEACDFIWQYLNQQVPEQGWKFGIAVNDGEKIVGVITVGKPVARFKDDGWTLEVTHCCTDGTKNVRYKLYESALKATKAMGYKRLITYTLISESGVAKNEGLMPEVAAAVGSKERATLSSIVTFPKEKKVVVSDIENLRIQLEAAKRLFKKQGYHDWIAEVDDALKRMDQDDFSFLERLWLKFAPTCEIDDLIIIAPHYHSPPLTQEQADELNDELARVANSTFAAIERIKNTRTSISSGVV